MKRILPDGLHSASQPATDCVVEGVLVVLESWGRRSQNDVDLRIVYGTDREVVDVCSSAPQSELQRAQDSRFARIVVASQYSQVGFKLDLTLTDASKSAYPNPLNAYWCEHFDCG